jgi:hypothetical protein
MLVRGPRQEVQASKMFRLCDGIQTTTSFILSFELVSLGYCDHRGALSILVRANISRSKSQVQAVTMSTPKPRQLLKSHLQKPSAPSQGKVEKQQQSLIIGDFTDKPARGDVVRSPEIQHTRTDLGKQSRSLTLAMRHSRSSILCCWIVSRRERKLKSKARHE